MFQKFLEFQKFQEMQRQMTAPKTFAAVASKPAAPVLLIPPAPAQHRAVKALAPSVAPPTRMSYPTFDPEASFRLIMSGKMGYNYSLSKHSLVFNLMRLHYAAHPEDFQLLNDGALHSDASGSANYFSIKFALPLLHSKLGKKSEGVMHVYGGQRFDKFIFNKIDIFSYDTKYYNAVVFCDRPGSVVLSAGEEDVDDSVSTH